MSRRRITNSDIYQNERRGKRIADNRLVACCSAKEIVTCLVSSEFAFTYGTELVLYRPSEADDKSGWPGRLSCPRPYSVEFALAEDEG